MSPGATFERVYHELKRMLAEGELPPGTPIEPALIGKQIASSITPVRDALHRLTGERLVEAPNHNGFRTPHLTEFGLRDLYAWNGQVLALAIRSMRQPLRHRRTSTGAPGEQAAMPVADLFVGIAQGSGNAEHVRAIEQLNDRLAPIRSVESRLLDDTPEEEDLLRRHCDQGDRTGLLSALDRYHRRRVRAVAGLLAAVVASEPRSP